MCQLCLMFRRPGVEFVPNPPTPPPQDPEYVNNMLEFLRNIENNVVDHRETQEEMMQVTFFWGAGGR